VQLAAILLCPLIFSMSLNTVVKPRRVRLASEMVLIIRRAASRPAMQSHTGKQVTFLQYIFCVLPHFVVSSALRRIASLTCERLKVDRAMFLELRSRIKLRNLKHTFHFYIEGGSNPSFTSFAGLFKVIYLLLLGQRDYRVSWHKAG
jgi:hypothetical protein